MKRHLLFLTAILSLTGSNQAADLFWSGDGVFEGGPGTWDTASPHFGPTGLGPFLDAWNNANSDNATFEATPGTVTISAITLNGTLTDNSGYTFSGSTITLGPSAAISVASGKITTISSILGVASGSLTKNGAGALVLSGANTFNAGFFLNAGILGLGGGTIGATTDKLTINADGVVVANNATAGRSPQNPVDQLGDLIVDETLKTVNPGNINFTLAQGPWTLKGGNRKITVSQQPGSSVILILGAAASVNGIMEDGSPRSLTKDGTGRLTIQCENTITGGLTISGGQVAVNATGTNPLGDPTLSTVNLAGGTLLVTVGTRSVTTQPIGNPVHVTADSFITTSSTAATVDLNFTNVFAAEFATTLTFTNINASGGFQPRLSGSFVYGEKVAIGNGTGTATTKLQSFNTSATGDQTFNDVVSGNGGYSRTASTAGTAGNTIMNAANTYSGGTTLTDGGIGLGIDSTGVGAPPTVSSGPVGTGTITVSPSAGRKPTLFASGGNWTVGNAITFANSTAPLIINGANELTLQGLITGPGSITKQDSGALRMSTTSSTTYSGGTSLLGGEIAFDANSTGPNDAPTGGPIGAGTLSVGSGTKLSALSNPRTVANHVLFIGTSSTLTGSRNLTFSGNVDLGGATVTLSVDNSAVTTLSGQVSNGGLTKDLGSKLVLSGANIYAGDTTVNGGILEMASTASVSQSSVFRLNTAQGTLQLSYAGVVTVNGLYINGVQMPNGIYGSETAPITGTGFLCVNNSPVMPQLGFTPSGGNLVFNWPGGSSTAPNLAANCGFKLQSQTNSAGISLPPVWYDYPAGGIVPVSVPIDPANPSVFFRLAPLP